MKTSPLRLTLLALALASLACQALLPAPTPTQISVCCAPPTEATDCCAPDVNQLGLTRLHPFAFTGEHALPNWQVEILDVVRGSPAWAQMKEANQFNEAPPEGYEYLLVFLRVTSTHNDADEHEIYPTDFQVTGDRRLSYFSSGQVPPEPVLDYTLRSGESGEGWASYFITQAEGNLMLMFSHVDEFDPANTRFIALEEGAGVENDLALATLEPNRLGQEAREPAQVGATLVTEDWEITVLEFARGADAQARVTEANAFNATPEPDSEYVTARVRVRYIGSEATHRIDSLSFKTLSGGLELDAPYVSDPTPALDMRFFPGGEYEGWITVRAKTNVAVVLVFSPFGDFDGENTRYIALK